MGKASKVDTVKRPFAKKIMGLSDRYNLWEVWSDFITMFACALSNRFDKANFEEREALYKKIISKYNEKERAVFPELVAEVVLALEKEPEQDFLGSTFMELELGNHYRGQFFTPYSLCQMMASIAGGSFAERVMDEGYVSINDCACGAGATLIAACHEAGRQLAIFGYNWQNHLLVTAQDVDFGVGMMCYIQLSLIGAAGYVKIGNTISDPMRAGDDGKQYWYTPMYFSDVWHYRRIFHSLDRLVEGAKEKKLHGTEEEK